VKTARALEDFKAALDAHAIVAITDARGTITYVNDKFCAISKWSHDELLGSDHRIINSGHHPKAFIQTLWDTIRSGKVWKGELKNRAKDGSIYWVDTTIVPFLGDDGQPVQFIAIRAEITARKLLEEHNAELVRGLELANANQKALLKEVHHRVKNNLQVITSLLRLEASRGAQMNAKAVLMEMQGRIHAMALLHESLYRGSNFGEVDLGAYLKQLSQQAFRAQASSGAVRLELDLASVPVTLDQATPAGLLVNELISNCLKHAFPQGRSGVVRVSLQPVAVGDGAAPGPWCLQVADNGVGLPADFATRRTQSLGLQLVDDLAVQMQGTLGIDSPTDHLGAPCGTAFSVVFTSQIGL
jgi:PAS domain S-box-containing protein